MHLASVGQQSTLMGLATGVAAVEVLVAIAVLYYRTRGNAVLIHTPVDHLDQRVDRAIHAGPVTRQQ
jgi:hypothetical protein